MAKLRAEKQKYQQEIDSLTTDINTKQGEEQEKSRTISAIEGIDPAIKTELEDLKQKLFEAQSALEKIKQE